MVEVLEQYGDWVYTEGDRTVLPFVGEAAGSNIRVVEDPGIEGYWVFIDHADGSSTTQILELEDMCAKYPEVEDYLCDRFAAAH